MGSGSRSPKPDAGPFDIIGDVHGCFDELAKLLAALGYHFGAQGSGAYSPAGRRAVFVGDLVGRGPAAPPVLRLVMGMVASGDALCVPGNHDVKLLRALQGDRVSPAHGLGESMAQLAQEPPEFRAQVADFIAALPIHLVLDEGKLVVAHAGMPAELVGQSSQAARAFALYGTTVEVADELALPRSPPWAQEYRGEATVVYGHTPVDEPVWLNRTICIDTGCVYGGMLTALRYPERVLVRVAAERTYWQPAHRRPSSPSSAAS